MNLSTRSLATQSVVQLTGSTTTVVLSEFTPDPGIINCQDESETELEELERQEQGVRDVERGAVGLEIAQGAIEITLGAVRIAAAGTTAEVLRREDNLAASRASLGPGVGNTPPIDILGPILRDDSELRKQVRSQRVPRRIWNASNSTIFQVCAEQRAKDLGVPKEDDRFHKWTEGFHDRIRRYSGFADALSWIRPHSVAPTPDPRSRGHSTGDQVNLPNVHEADRLLKLLENLLDTNNRVLKLLGMDLPPITNSGSFILRQYKDKVDRRKQAVARYGVRGSMDEEDYEDEDSDKFSRANGDRHWLHSSIDREEPVKTFTDELARLKRIRKVSQHANRRKH